MKSFVHRWLYPWLPTGVFLLLYTVCLSGQNLVQLSVDDGLSQGYVTSITCDEEGFIWMATMNGLNRYDGHSFQVWNEREGGLNSNFVLYVKNDKRGIVWVVTNQGVHILDRRTGKVGTINMGESVLGLHYQSLAIDEKGDVWLACNNKLYYLQIGDHLQTIDELVKGIKPFVTSYSDEMGVINTVTTYKNNILLTTSKGVFLYDQKRDAVDALPVFGTEPCFGALFNAAENQIFIRYKDHIAVLKDNKIQKIETGDPVWNHDYNFIQYGEKIFILSSFHIYEWKEDKLVSLDVPIDVEIVSAEVDHYGQFWLGTNAKGVRILKKQDKYFSTVLKGTSIGGAIFDANDQIWFPIRKSDFRLDYRLVDKKKGKLGRSLSKKHYMTIVSASGEIWGMTEKEELEKPQADGLSQVNIPLPSGMFTGRARTLHYLRYSKELVIGDHSGQVVFFNPETRHIWKINFSHLLNGVTGGIKGVVEDQQGSIWFGTPAGLIKVTRNNLHVEIIKANGRHGQTLSSEKINDVFIDPNDPGIVWVGTVNGLNRLETSSGNITCYNQKDGLSDDFIYTILSGKPGELWLGSNRGLLCFNHHTKQTVQYTVSDGLPASEFNTGMAWRGSDATLYFGTVDGIVFFNLYNMPQNLHTPDIRITALEVNGHPLEQPDSLVFGALVPFLNEISLLPDENNLAFRFTVMDFFNAQKYNCRYMLIGADDNWRYAWSNNLITYTNLSPGNYTFVVATRTSNGEWGPGRLIQVHILAPWWNRWWAWLVWVGLTCAIVWSIVRTQRRMSNMRRQIEIEHIKAEYSAALEKNKTQMFVNISHEIRTPITLILGLAEDIEAGAKPDIAEKTTLIRQCGQQLLNVSQQVLDLIKLDENQLELHLQYGDLSAFIRFCAEPFCPVLKKRQMAFTMELPPEPGVMMLFDPKYIQAIISNLLSNAVKFTEDGGAIQLKMWKMEPDQVVIAIRDTGIGIAPKHLSKIFGRYYQVENRNRISSGTGIGLTYVAELVKLMKGNIAVESEPGTGSTFTVTLPIEYPADDLLPVAPLLPEADTPADDDTHHRNVPPGIQILVIEDNVEMAKFIKNSLTPEYSVEIAHDGLSGLHKAREIVPELIISDVMMPELNGFDLCAAVKSDLVTNHIPVIMLSARASDADRMKGLQEGADLYITKPFNRELLRLKVANLIALRHNIQMKMQKSFAEGVGKSDRETPEKVFTEKVFAAVEAHYPKPEFGVDDLCRIFNMSNSQFHRKLSAITGITPGQLIKEHRLRRGKELLATKPDLTIAEIAYHVGFRDPNYFSHAFSAAFGISPRQYRNSI